MTAQKTDITSEELGKAMSEVREAKAVWKEAVLSVDIARSKECEALNTYNKAIKRSPK